MARLARLTTAVLVLGALGLAAGCGSSDGVCRRVTAFAGEDQAVMVGEKVYLSAQGSYSAESRLAFSWMLVAKPAGSATALSIARSYNTTLVPDLAGTYIVWLRVMGSCTSEATVTITASDPEPIVTVPAALYGNVGSPVTLDASGSHDVSGAAVAFGWTLAAKPDGSAAALVDVSAGVVHLAADKEGVYTVNLVVTGAHKTVSRDVTVTVWRALQPVTFRPIDVEYDRPLDRIVAVSDQPPELHLYDAATGQDAVIALPVVPTCVGVSPDGKVAAVGHDAWVSIVDLEAKAVLKTWPTTVLTGDVVVTDPLTLADHTARLAYLNSSDTHAIDASNGGEIAGGKATTGHGRLKLQPGSNHLFQVTLGSSPVKLYRWDFDPATGALTMGPQSPYHGDYPIGSNFWVSEDGGQILTAAGTRFRTSDQTYSGKVSFKVLAWADAPAAPSAAAGKWLVQPGEAWDSPDDDLSLWTVDAEYLANPERTDLPKLGLGAVAHPLHGRYVFFDKAGTKKISIAQFDPDAGVLDDFVILTF